MGRTKFTEADKAMADLSTSRFSVVTKENWHFVVRVIKEKIDDMNLIVDCTKRNFGMENKKAAIEYFKTTCEKYPEFRVELLNNRAELLQDNGVIV